MKKLQKPWVSILLILVAALGGIAGTSAYFTATRTAQNNEFTSGTLDLSLTGPKNIVNEPFVVENMGANSTLSGTKTWTVKNNGTLPGRLLIRLTNLRNLENGCNDQEKTAEPDCDKDNNGELGQIISMNVALDGVNKVSSTLSTVNMLKIGDDWNDSVETVILAPNESREITMYWKTDESKYGNEIQSDSLSFDTVFQLTQQFDGPTPANR